MRGAFLNCRFAVNGIQNAFKSFGAILRSSAIAPLPVKGATEAPYE